MLSDYVISQMIDAAIIERKLEGEDISEFPLYQKTPKGPILTYNGACELARLIGIKRKFVKVTESKRFRLTMHDTIYHATVVVQLGGRTRTGASTSHNRPVAVELAFRNAVKGIVSLHDETGGL